MGNLFPLFINSRLKETLYRQDILDPSTGEVFAQACRAGKPEAEEALSAARQAFDAGAWPGLPLSRRKEALLKIAQGILEHAGELAILETRNTGKPIKETTFMDIPSAAQTFKYFAENLEFFLQGQERSVSAEAGARLLRQPLGVIVLIVPWNYPLLIASWKMAAALAAGNSVILKPSSLTPLTAIELAKIVQSAGLPAGTVNVLCGAGDDIGRMLCSDSRVDMISFTGSNSVGKKILEYSAQQVKKTIMELGGKSAAIVLKDADLEAAVNGCLCSIFLNQGQMCTAMSRILVEDDIYDDFLNDFVAKAKKIKLGIGMDYQTQMGPLISSGQRDKVAAAVAEAGREGAQILCGGNIPEGEGLGKGFFFAPAVLAGVSPEQKIFREELFGPVACVHKFSAPEEAAALANQTDFGLAACVWSKNEKVAQGLADKLCAGTVWINTYGMFYPELPYGGFKQSGFGKELGKEGLLEYTRLKNVISDRSKDSKPLVNYWYGF